MKKLVCLLSLSFAGVAACGGSDSILFPGGSGGGPLGGDEDAASPAPTTTGTGTNPPGTPKPPPAGHDAGTPANDAGGAPPDASAPDASSPCYSEPYSPNADLSDLKNAYSQNVWLATTLEVMKRRQPTASYLLNLQQNDSQLASFADPSSWANLMQSTMMMLNGETSVYDFAQSSTAHTYVLRNDLVMSLTPVTTWQRGEIMALITDNATATYDQSELQGSSAADDLVTLADDSTAFTNGLAAITAVGDQVTAGISARDGAAANIYYLELFLHVGRTNHATAYAGLKASADWQKLVRYLWARGFFWDGQAKPNANLDIASAPIWAHVNDPANLSEIKLFTGDDAAYVACHP